MPDDSRSAVSFHHSLLPMLIADDERRYVDANTAACLLLRLPRARVLALRVDDLTPAENRPMMRAMWQQFLLEGTQAGLYELVMPDGQRVRAAYSATANYRPGLHISMLDLQHDDADGSPTGTATETQALTPREREILALVAMGETSQSVAQHLHVAVPTVETHIRRCMAKLGARNRPHAVLLALKRGDISLL